MTRDKRNRATVVNTSQTVRPRVQAVSAAQEWKDRMKAARKALPDGVGQQDVIIWVCTEYPSLDTLTFATRWRNAWQMKVSDPEITQAIEAAAKHFESYRKQTVDRLKRQGLSKPRK